MVHFSALLLAGLVSALPAAATDVGLVGLARAKAVIVIDGGAPRTLAVGARIGDVKLISVDADGATLEFDGKRHRLVLGQQAFSPSGAGGTDQSITLVADGRGHFVTTGTVNGATIPFMVDTGATTVALGASHARNANLDLRNARIVAIQTANGVTHAALVNLNPIRLGAVTLHDVPATVAAHDMPQALLGMSFLNRMDMKRDGETMTLRRRF
jgi:aspartyl protease family protein